MQFPLITQQKKNKSRRKKLRNRLLVEFQDIIQDTLLENKQLGGLLMHIQLNDGPIKTIRQKQQDIFWSLICLKKFWLLNNVFNKRFVYLFLSKIWTSKNDFTVFELKNELGRLVK